MTEKVYFLTWPVTNSGVSDRSSDISLYPIMFIRVRTSMLLHIASYIGPPLALLVLQRSTTGIAIPSLTSRLISTYPFLPFLEVSPPYLISVLLTPGCP